MPDLNAVRLLAAAPMQINSDTNQNIHFDKPLSAALRGKLGGYKKLSLQKPYGAV